MLLRLPVAKPPLEVLFTQSQLDALAAPLYKRALVPLEDACRQVNLPDIEVCSRLDHMIITQSQRSPTAALPSLQGFKLPHGHAGGAAVQAGAGAARGRLLPGASQP